ncbi:MAG: 3-phosphoshikimate 1-carboxyvinyltransferase, partial [Blastocatellia bacterium]
MSSSAPRDVVLRRASRLVGTFRVPGDKSISHRAAMLAAFASGVTRIEGYALNGDCLSTLGCIAALGAAVERDETTVTIASGGRESLVAPAGPLDA